MRKGGYTVQAEETKDIDLPLWEILLLHIPCIKTRQEKAGASWNELMRLPDRERFTAAAEAKLLNEAEAHSYQHAAESIKTNGQTITKDNGNEQSPLYRKRDPGDGRDAQGKESL